MFRKSYTNAKCYSKNSKRCGIPLVHTPFRGFRRDFGEFGEFGAFEGKGAGGFPFFRGIRGFRKILRKGSGIVS